MIRLVQSSIFTEATFWSLTFKLCRKQCLYVLGILRYKADTSEDPDLSSRTQLIKVFSEECQKFLISSCFEPILQHVQRKWPMIDELSCRGFAPIALAELDVVL